MKILLLLIITVLMSCRTVKNLSATSDTSMQKKEVVSVGQSVDVRAASTVRTTLIDSMNIVATIEWLSRPDSTGQQYVKKKAVVSANKKTNAIQQEIDTLKRVQRDSSFVEHSDSHQEMKNENKEVKVYKPPLWGILLLVLIIIVYLKFRIRL